MSTIEILKYIRDLYDSGIGIPCAGAVKALDEAIAALDRDRWISVEERLPEEFVSVQAHMTDASPFPEVREAYLAGGEWFFPALDGYYPVDMWRLFEEPPKEET